jgi:hypothetical protein
LTDSTVIDRAYAFDFQPQKRLDPKDPDNPDFSQFKIIFIARGEERSTEFQSSLYIGWIKDYKLIPVPILTATGDVLQYGNVPDSLDNGPSMALLLNIPGNNASLLSFWGNDITHYIERLNASLTMSEFDAFTPGYNYSIPPEMQKMLIPFVMDARPGK